MRSSEVTEDRSHTEAAAALRALADPAKAAFFAKFFKTGKGQYAECDRFLGLTVPAVRKVAKEYRDLALEECEALLQSDYNEVRLLALLILVRHFEKGTDQTRGQVYRLYLRQRGHVNNWNLVDGSAPYIVGPHLLQRDRSILYKLAQSRVLWDRRIAVLATFAFIRAGDFADTLRLTEQLLQDKHDLMHKACGWMLREVGKRNEAVLVEFLHRHAPKMPRTMLRYAIERFAPAQRTAFLKA